MGKYNVSILGYLGFFVKEKQHTGVTREVDGKRLNVSYTTHKYKDIYAIAMPI